VVLLMKDALIEVIAGSQKAFEGALADRLYI
jgi:hypothetical protein